VKRKITISGRKADIILFLATLVEVAEDMGIQVRTGDK
jgi:hypothetical protein